MASNPSSYTPVKSCEKDNSSWKPPTSIVRLTSRSDGLVVLVISTLLSLLRSECLEMGLEFLAELKGVEVLSSLGDEEGVDLLEVAEKLLLFLFVLDSYNVLI